MPSKVDQLITLSKESEFWIHDPEDQDASERVAQISDSDGDLITSVRRLSKDQALAFAKWIVDLYGDQA
jgi:hypothetical protein